MNLEVFGFLDFQIFLLCYLMEALTRLCSWNSRFSEMIFELCNSLYAFAVYCFLASLFCQYQLYQFIKLLHEHKEVASHCNTSFEQYLDLPGMPKFSTARVLFHQFITLGIAGQAQTPFQRGRTQKFAAEGNLQFQLEDKRALRAFLVVDCTPFTYHEQFVNLRI